MSPARDDDRLAALDGLRGVAALVVLLSHIVEASVPALSETLSLGGDPGGLAHWFMRTPLAVLWAGPEFVIVFFVLSGFVLTRALRAHPTTVSAFYAARSVRLYLPVWLSLIPAAALLLLIPRATGLGGAGVSFWLDTYAHPVGLSQVARDMALVLPDHVGAGEGTLNGALWSLRWEVFFSLALPILLLAEGLVRRMAAPLVVAALLAVDIAHGHATLMFAPPFVVGVVLALHEARIREWRTRLAGRGAVLAVGVSLCLLSADLWLPDAVRAMGPGGALVVAGAGLAVLCPLLYGSVARPLATRPVQWLGSRSFSLYLVHHPIVLAFAYGLHAPPFATLLALAVPASLIGAELFHRIVERPCHRLARAAGAQVAQRTTRAAPPRAAPVKA
ncbi:acyltransferase [Baekduia sp.]|jgi:peptidoglycan/LPS O-acetylase OafA/YrhL|uniref:acyltransferase family protein n=1 Tax=Baekduia sp. TaxID=2600305 RepID=UPI002DFBD344|nr:acyltransferase [Baekduia sp.]